MCSNDKTNMINIGLELYHKTRNERKYITQIYDNICYLAPKRPTRKSNRKRYASDSLAPEKRPSMTQIIKIETKYQLQVKTIKNNKNI